MSDTTLLSHFIANLNTNVFLREFSFSQTRFTSIGGTQVELADHVVRIGHFLFLYQRKERDSSAPTTIDEWLKKKVVTRATRQIRATIQLLRSCGKIPHDHRFNNSRIRLIWIIPALLAVNLSSSRLWRRSLRSHANVRSTTHRQGITWKPFPSLLVVASKSMLCVCFKPRTHSSSHSAG